MSGKVRFADIAENLSLLSDLQINEMLNGILEKDRLKISETLAEIQTKQMDAKNILEQLIFALRDKIVSDEVDRKSVV